MIDYPAIGHFFKQNLFDDGSDGFEKYMYG